MDRPGSSPPASTRSAHRDPPIPLGDRQTEAPSPEMHDTAIALFHPYDPRTNHDKGSERLAYRPKRT